MKRFGISVGIASLLATSSSFASEEKSTCLTAYEQGQRAKMDGRMSEARDKFLQCANEACPAALRPDCAKWLEEADAALASMIVRAHDATGNEVLDVAVYEGDKLIASSLTGRALSLDPGKHTLRFQFADGSSVTRDVILHEGDRGVQVDVSVTPVAAGAGTPEATPSVQSARPTPATVYIFGALGAVGVASAAAFAITGRNEQFSMLEECRPNCSSDRVSSVKRSYLIADISLAVGLLSGALAGYFYATRPTVATATARPTFGVALGPHDSRFEARFAW